MQYELRLAARSSTFFGAVLSSSASGEGVMCFFRGPGRLWLQTHKPPTQPSDARKNVRHTSGGANGALGCMILVFVFLLVIVVFVAGALQSGVLAGYESPSRRAGSDSQVQSELRGAERVRRDSGGGRGAGAGHREF